MLNPSNSNLDGDEAEFSSSSDPLDHEDLLSGDNVSHDDVSGDQGSHKLRQEFEIYRQEYESIIYEVRKLKTELNDMKHQRHILHSKLKVLEEDAIHDTLTGLYSCAYFMTRLEDEIIRSERYRHFFSLALLHVNFKESTSEKAPVLSSLTLSDVMRQIAEHICIDLLRRTDTLAIYNQRQLIVLMPETDSYGAALMVKRYGDALSTFDEVIFDEESIIYQTLTYPTDASTREYVHRHLSILSERCFVPSMISRKLR